MHTLKSKLITYSTLTLFILFSLFTFFYCRMKEIIEQIYWAGMVHDIGKILIDEKILNKSDPLTDKEFAEITEIALKLLKEKNELDA